MLTRPDFKAHLQAHVLPGEGAIILSEEGGRALRGPVYELLVPLIDGERSSDDLAAALAERIAPAKVYYALMLLEKGGYIAEAAPAVPTGAGEPPAATSRDQLAATARWVAAARAVESRRQDRLFDDRWAEALAGDPGRKWLADFDVTAPIAVRTRFFDDFLLEAVDAPEVRQVVIVAAGMDTRAFRLPWPGGTALFELDQPEVLDLKEEILTVAGATAGGGRRAIGVDLTAEWQGALLDAGFDPRRPSAWLLEGLLVYLPKAAVLDLLNRVSALAAAGSRIGFDLVNRDMLTSPLSRRWLRFLEAAGVPWRFGADEPEQLLAARGWVSPACRSWEEVAPSYGRALPAAPRALLGIPRSFLVTAHRGSAPSRQGHGTPGRERSQA
jgi:methyltransferase (TIGR00027 family)